MLVRGQGITATTVKACLREHRFEIVTPGSGACACACASLPRCMGDLLCVRLAGMGSERVRVAIRQSCHCTRAILSLQIPEISLHR